MPDFTLGEILLVALLAFFILGPERLPEYAAKLAQWIRQLRVMAEGAKGQLKEQLGPEYQDVNWRQYDPRQYDPRRIVREALMDPAEPAAQAEARVWAPEEQPGRAAYDPGKPTPWDSEAT